MGLVFGKIKVETPKYEVLNAGAADYEIRKYSPSVIAEITYAPSQLQGDRDGGFKILTNYIGVFSQPQNSKPDQKIAMTTPVLTKSEKVSMTLPVITAAGKDDNVTMQFVLPSKYGKKEDAPVPTDERVVIREEVERKYGVVKFSGVATDGVVGDKVEKLRECLERDGHKIVGDFVLARYNPPWITLPPFRTNEVMLPIE